jgi:hypothetical protein
MVPLEVLFVTLIIVFGFVGAARGYPRELGVTTLILTAMVVLTYMQPALAFFDQRIGPSLGFKITQPSGNSLEFFIYAFVFAAIVFASYAGETFSFPGMPKKGRTGSLISFLNGSFNGYLIIGTIWYFLDNWSYIVGGKALIQLPLTATAQGLVAYLPPRIFDRNILLGIIALMLIMRVRR